MDGATRSHLSINQSLTGTKQVEQWFMMQLVELYGVEDEDALPINFDLLEVMETPKDKRPAFLKEKLVDCPKGTFYLRVVYGPGGGCVGGLAVRWDYWMYQLADQNPYPNCSHGRGGRGAPEEGG